MGNLPLYYDLNSILSVFIDVASIHANRLEQTKVVTRGKRSTPIGLFWDTNIFSVSLFWNTKMAAVMLFENNLYELCLFTNTVFVIHIYGQ